MKIIEIIAKEYINNFWVNRINEMIHSLGQKVGKRLNNYNNLELNKHLCFHVLVDSKDNIVTFAGVYNGGRYPQGVYRILNRVFVHPDHRVKNFGYPGLATKFILPLQLREFKSDIKAAFVSRENMNGCRFLKYWSINLAPSEFGPWNLSTKFVKVAPESGEYREAYQHISYRGDLFSFWKPKQIDYREWLLLNRFHV